MIALRVSVGADNDVVRNLGHYIEERADQHLRAVGTTLDAELLAQLIRSLHVELRSVDAEDPSPLEAMPVTMSAFERGDHPTQEAANRLGLQPSPGLAECRRRDRMLRRQRDAMVLRTVPELVEQMPVASPCAISDQSKEKGDQQLRRELAVARECLRRALEVRGTRLAQMSRDQLKATENGGP